jgi:hypothetical protein
MKARDYEAALGMQNIFKTWNIEWCCKYLIIGAIICYVCFCVKRVNIDVFVWVFFYLTRGTMFV